MAEDPTYQNPKGFDQRHLSREQAEEMYKASLIRLEQQIMGCRFDEYLQDPDSEGMTDAGRKRERFERGLRMLETDYEAWKRKNPVSREKSAGKQSGVATPQS
jgi:hypothetical protein